MPPAMPRYSYARCLRWGLGGNQYPALNFSQWSAWIDGDNAGGCGGFMAETFPYWFNGAVPMAVLSDDADLLALLRRQVSAMLAAAAAQDEWIGPLDARSRARVYFWRNLGVCRRRTPRAGSNRRVASGRSR